MVDNTLDYVREPNGEGGLLLPQRVLHVNTLRYYDARCATVSMGDFFPEGHRHAHTYD